VRIHGTPKRSLLRTLVEGTAEPANVSFYTKLKQAKIIGTAGYSIFTEQQDSEDG